MIQSELAMRSESVVALFTIIVLAIGISISAVAASTHGAAATPLTSLIIVFGVLVTVGFALAALIMNGRARRIQDLR